MTESRTTRSLTLKQRGLIAGFVRTVHHIDDFADERIARLDSRAIREADAWLTVSALWRDRLAETYGIGAPVCGNGVDIGRFRPECDGLEDDLRGLLGIGPGPVFLSVGGVEERKNTAHLLDAFARLLAIRPDAKLVIAGGASLLDHGSYQAKFRSRLAAMGEAGASVRLLGIVADSDMPRLYRLASALVFASVKEGFGLCVLEAMASGRSCRGFARSSRSRTTSRRKTRSGAIRSASPRLPKPWRLRSTKSSPLRCAGAAGRSPPGLSGAQSREPMSQSTDA